MLSEYVMGAELVGIVNPAWRCTGACGRLMYNVEWFHDENGNLKSYPVAGAPEPLFISVAQPRVCRVCWEMFMVLNRELYWKKLDQEEKNELKSRNKLRPGNDYFG